MTSVKLERGSATADGQDNELQEIQYEILVEPNFPDQATPSASTSSKSLIHGIRRPRPHVYSVINSSTDDGTGSTTAVAAADFQADEHCSTIELSEPSSTGEDGNTEDYIIHHHHDVNTTPVAFQRPSNAGRGAVQGKLSVRGKRGRPRGRSLSAATIRVKKEADPDNPDAVPKKRFCSRWFNIPEIAPWLEESILPNHAYCKFCQKDLTAGKSELYKHMNTKRHRQRAECFGILMRQNTGNDVSASERTLQDLRGMSPPDQVSEGVVVARSSPPPTARTLPFPSNITFPSRKFQVYLADDMHVPQSKEVMEAAESLRRGRVRELESRAAQLLGKEAAFFCLTGTMANTLAMMAHCPQSGGVVIAGDRSHLYRHCQDALSRLNHVSVRVARNEADGRLNLEEVRELLSPYTGQGAGDDDGADQCRDRRPPPQYQLTRPTVLCLENTHTFSGGHALPEYFMLMARKTCDELELQLHLDGARLLHAAYASDSSPAALAAHADTVTLCLNKGIDAPNGSIVAGPREFIDRCRQLSSVFCVSSVRTEALAASCSKALSHYVQHVAKAHLYARNLVKGLSRLNSSAVTLSYGEGATNSILLECDGVRVTPQHLVDRLRQMPSSEIETLKERTSIAARVWSRNTVRLVTHSGLTPEQVNAALKKLRHVFNEYDNLLVLEYNVLDQE